MQDLGTTLDAMDSTRLLLALAFVACYASAIGHLASERVRRWSIGLAALAGLAFVGLTNPWAHGALLVVFAVLGVGLFIALAWAFSAWATHAASAAPALVPISATVDVVRTPPAVLVGGRVRRIRRRFSTL